MVLEEDFALEFSILIAYKRKLLYLSSISLFDFILKFNRKIDSISIQNIERDLLANTSLV